MSAEDIIKDSQIYAKKNGLKLNSDKNITRFIAEGIAANEKKYGKRYCGCRIFSGDSDENSVCPCVWLKEDVKKNGQCHCGLFFKD